MKLSYSVFFVALCSVCVCWAEIAEESLDIAKESAESRADSLETSEPENELEIDNKPRDVTIIGGIKRTCPLREMYLECPDAHICQTTCATLNAACLITPTCTPGCFCRPGYARDATNRCVQISKCPGTSCPRNEEFIVCSSEWKCEKTCAGRNDPCPGGAFCRGGCQCRDGYFRNSTGECVRAQKC